MLWLAITFASALTPVYGVIIDAGPAATRLQTYQWDADNEQQLPIPVGNSSESKTPLHLAYYRPEIVPDVFKEIMPAAIEAVPEELQPQTTIYCFGTAGMRGIQEDERQAVISAIKDHLKSNYTFKVADDSVDSLTIQEEGLYQWIAVNLVLDNFDDGKTTVPVADMSERSTNVVFATDASGDAYSRHVYNVAIFDKTFHVFCYSYEELGIDEGEENYTNSIAQVVGRSSIDAACYPQGYQAQFKYLDINGTGNYDDCYASLSNSTLITNGCSGTFCSFEGLAMPNSMSGKNLHGISVFADPVEMFKLTPKLSENVKFAKEYCAKSIDELQGEYASVSQDQLAKYCLMMAYTYNFLVRGLGISEDEDVQRITSGNVTNITTGEDVEVTVGWPYGAILTRTSASLVIDQPEGFSKILAIILGVAAVLILILVITCIIVRCRKIEKEKDELNIRQHHHEIFQSERQQLLQQQPPPQEQQQPQQSPREQEQQNEEPPAP